MKVKVSQFSVMLLCFTFSLVLMVFSLWFLRIVPHGMLDRFDLTTSDLIYYVPLSVWIALFALEALLMFLCLHNPNGLTRRAAYGFMFVTLLVILTVFYGLPYIAESNPRFVDSWVHGRAAKGIVENGNLQPEKFHYQAYPSSFIFLSIFSIATGIELTSLLRILPLILIPLFFAFLTLFISNLFKNLKLATISVLVYGLSTFALTFHFSPEIFGWLFFFLLLAFLAKSIQENAGFSFYSRENFAVILLLLIGIATTHPVTEFATLLFMLVLLVLGKRIWKTRFAMYGLVMVAVILFVAWTSFFGLSYFASVVQGFRNAFRTVILDWGSSVAARPLLEYYPSEISTLLQYRRVLYLTIGLTSFFGGYLLWKQSKKKFTFLLALLTASVIAAPLTLLGILPLERTIRVAFVPLSICSGYLILKRRKVGALVLLLLLATLPINFASLYWNEVETTMTHDWEISSAKFASSNFHGIILGSFKAAGIFAFYGNFSKVYSDYHLAGTRPDVFNSSFIEEERIELVYVSQLTVLRERYSGRDLDMDLFLGSPPFNRVYSNEYSIVLVRNHNGTGA